MKHRIPALSNMGRREQYCLTTIIILSLVLPIPISNADEVISVEENEIMKSGDFKDSEEWEITTTAGFSGDNADYSIGMVADNELSITHSRPDNYGMHTEWASFSPTNSNNTLGSPDSYYTWSKGPNMTMNGYDFNSFNSFIIYMVYPAKSYNFFFCIFC